MTSKNNKWPRKWLWWLGGSLVATIMLVRTLLSSGATYLDIVDCVHGDYTRPNEYLESKAYRNGLLFVGCSPEFVNQVASRNPFWLKFIGGEWP